MELPAQLRAHAARHACAEYMEKFEQKLQSNLAQAGYTHGREHARFRQSLDLLGPQTTVFAAAAPYYFPACRKFNTSNRRPSWLDQVESHARHPRRT
jgi:hypothetical protein